MLAAAEQRRGVLPANRGLNFNELASHLHRAKDYCAIEVCHWACSSTDRQLLALSGLYQSHQSPRLVQLALA